MASTGRTCKLHIERPHPVSGFEPRTFLLCGVSTDTTPPCHYSCMVKSILTGQAGAGTFNGFGRRLHGLRTSVLIPFISSLIPFCQILFCLRPFGLMQFVWGHFVQGCLVWSSTGGHIRHDNVSFSMVWGCVVQRMMPFYMMSVSWVCPNTYTVAVFCFSITHYQVLCTVNMLCIMIFLCNLGVKCTQLTMDGIKERTPSSDST